MIGETLVRGSIVGMEEGVPDSWTVGCMVLVISRVGMGISVFGGSVGVTEGVTGFVIVAEGVAASGVEVSVDVESPTPLASRVIAMIVGRISDGIGSACLVVGNPVHPLIKLRIIMKGINRVSFIS